jgi:hypothetical protein
LVSASLIVLAAAGCGRKTGTVSGKVTLNGEPLKGGNVSFVRSDGVPTKSGTIAEDGTYKIEDVPVGNATVVVETSSLKPMFGGGGAKGPGGKPGGGVAPKNEPPPGAQVGEHYQPGSAPNNAERYVAIPAKYEDAAQTSLHYEVKAGPQDYPIPLTNTK